ncbi:OLC1v1001158C1 [Oldenlandia corymbosa var. corymbosa]|uniref:OLC1v1001158C1 n=1 Tax=Oldenlandia corymbosa var. corymbosa TaxID=529605 RepID=A0AAV1D5H0_OLDCO|nr:OLC1v1001158C1 [Oldenlandia corymbosa var. corymbosa]
MKKRKEKTYQAPTVTQSSGRQWDGDSNGTEEGSNGMVTVSLSPAVRGEAAVVTQSPKRGESIAGAADGRGGVVGQRGAECGWWIESPDGDWRWNDEGCRWT